VSKRQRTRRSPDGRAGFGVAVNLLWRPVVIARSEPEASMSARILITGATGYVGGRLLAALAAERREVRCLVRRASRFAAPPDIEVVEGDCLDHESLAPALAGVDTAYYLVHSMSAPGDFAVLDRRAAETFGSAAARAGVRRIIYLGGLGDADDDLSPHLSSRHETGRVLAASGVPVVEFRASIVVGAGSLSFEMVRALAERLPVMVCPRWVSVQAQPIAATDVVRYLIAALDLPPGQAGTYEIGGPDVVSYGEILRLYARLRGFRRLLVSVPLLTPRLSSLWLALVTPLHARIGRKLIDGVRNPTIVRSDLARRTFAVEPKGLHAALEEAIADTPPDASRLIDERSVAVAASPAVVFERVTRIGGDTGWYFGNLLWRLRGALDRALGGTGLSRGRTNPDRCEAGDVIDCWRVVDVQPGRGLRLLAEMRMPGRAWLSFEMEPDGSGGTRLRQVAEFEPRGLAGRLYWYGLVPVHAIMFAGMIRAIAAAAEATDSQTPELDNLDTLTEISS